MTTGFVWRRQNRRYGAGPSVSAQTLRRHAEDDAIPRRRIARAGAFEPAGRNDRDQALSAPEALAMWVAMKSISPGDRQS
jgi:hypothetical protein